MRFERKNVSSPAVARASFQVVPRSGRSLYMAKRMPAVEPLAIIAVTPGLVAS